MSLRFSNPKILLLLILLLQLALQWHYLFFDFWNDELYTLEHFVFVPWSTIFTDYHVPNNHVLASVVFKLLATVQGIETLGDAIESTWRFRALFILSSGVTTWLVYQTGEKLKPQAGILAALFLCLTLPFLNFTLELRGYGLSLLFVAAVAYLLVSDLNRWHLILLTLSAALLVCSIPSNYYLLLSFILGTAGLYLVSKDKSWLQKSFALVAGIMLSVLFYLPVFDLVFFNEYAQNATGNLSMPFSEKATWVLNDMLGSRYFGLIVSAIGCSLLLLFGSRQNKTMFIWLLFACFAPLLISFLRADNAPMRTFVTMAPLLALLIGFSSAFLVNGRWSNTVMLFLWLTYATEGLANIRWTRERCDAECLYNIQHDGRSQNLSCNYYQHRYQPNKDVVQFAAQNLASSVLIHHCEPHDIRHFLDRHGIGHWNEDRLDSLIQTQRSFYAVSSNPDLFASTVLKISANARVKPLSSSLTYHNFLAVSFDTTQISQIADSLRSTKLKVLFISLSLGGLNRWIDTSAVEHIASNSEDAIAELNAFINNAAHDSAIIVHYNHENDLLKSIIRDSYRPAFKAFEVHFCNCVRIANQPPNLFPSENLNSKNPYSKSLKKVIKDDKPIAIRIDMHLGKIEGDVKLVVNIDRDGKSVYWDDIAIDHQNMGEQLVYYKLPEGAQLRDELTVYLWLNGEGSALLKGLAISDLNIDSN